MQPIVEHDLAGHRVVPCYQCRSIIEKDLACDTAKMPEGCLHPIEPGRLTVVEKRRRVCATRIAKRCHEDVDADFLTSDLHSLLAKIDLYLMAWRCLEAHRR